ncbi:uncharacterized protein LOC133294564 [Gastrolobium bilobum]|uniref:uncharacterized protein LOC133294564 n=1 Tax=Gastrolobium bilobum TaxID=150636 RepID=UPI002AB0BE62|nr:uncharacterized protein LOC133294564 [Gastrolobium bilobum]
MISTMIVSETVTVTAAVGLRVLPSCQSSCNFSIADSGTEQISAMIMPYDAVAPPPVKPAAYKVPRRRTLLRRKRRTKRRLSDDGSGDAGDEGFFYGDGGDGPFGGGGGGFGGSGGGGGWNDNRFGDGHNWDEPSLPDPAFDFVYQVLSWIMLSNCLHFSFKKIVRIVADSAREKVPARLAPIC